MSAWFVLYWTESASNANQSKLSVYQCIIVYSTHTFYAYVCGKLYWFFCYVDKWERHALYQLLVRLCNSLSWFWHSRKMASMHLLSKNNKSSFFSNREESRNFDVCICYVVENWNFWDFLYETKMSKLRKQWSIYQAGLWIAASL